MRDNWIVCVLVFLAAIVSAACLLLSCSDENIVDSRSDAPVGVAVIKIVIPQEKSTGTNTLNPTTKAIISFYDSSDKLLSTKNFPVTDGKITGSISVKAGSDYHVELLCYDTSDSLTHNGTADNVTITAGKQTVITITLTPAAPGIPVACCSNSLIVSGTEYSLSWSEVSRAKSYSVEESDEPSFADPVEKTIVGTSESFTKISDERMTWYYRVCANNAQGSGAWSNVVHVTVEPVQTHTLSMIVDPPGAGTTDPISGTHRYVHGAGVTITAYSAEGYRFTGWNGPVADADSATTTIEITADTTVTATFEAIPPEQYTLTMAVNEAGWGTTAPSSGTHTYDEDTVVDIAATAAEGYRFAGWTGDVADESSDGDNGDDDEQT